MARLYQCDWCRRQVTRVYEVAFERWVLCRTRLNREACADCLGELLPPEDRKRPPMGLPKFNTSVMPPVDQQRPNVVASEGRVSGPLKRFHLAGIRPSDGELWWLDEGDKRHLATFTNRSGVVGWNLIFPDRGFVSDTIGDGGPFRPVRLVVSGEDAMRSDGQSEKRRD